MPSSDIATTVASDDDSVVDDASMDAFADGIVSGDGEEPVHVDCDANAASAVALLVALKARTQLTGVTATGLLCVLTLLADKWLSPFDNVNNWWGVTCVRLGLDPAVVYAPNEIDVAVSREIVGIMELFKYMDALVHVDDANQSEVMTSIQTSAGVARREKFSRIVQVIHMSHRALLYMTGAIRIADDDVVPMLGWEEIAVL